MSVLVNDVFGYVNSTSLADTEDPMVTVGEQLLFVSSVLLVQSVTPIVVQLQTSTGDVPGTAKFGVLSSRLSYVGTAITLGTGAVNMSGLSVDTNGDGIVDRVVFDLGQVIDTPHEVKSLAADTLTFERTWRLFLSPRVATHSLLLSLFHSRG